MSTAQAYVSGPVAVSHGGRIIGSRDLVVLCLAVAACCASFVFAFLYNSDQHYATAAVQQQTAAPAQTLPLASSTQPASSAQTHIDFTLRRSNKFQPVGPIQLGIWRIDTRHDSVRASILVSHRRIDLKRVTLNERVVIPASPSQTLELVISRITRNEVTGYIAPTR